MHIDLSTYTNPRGKSYTRHLLRESYRSGGKVHKRTLANLSQLEPARLEALRQVQNLTPAGMHYITAITRPQIEALLKSGVLQPGRLDPFLADVDSGDRRRYVLHRNPLQAEISAARRADQLATWRRSKRPSAPARRSCSTCVPSMCGLSSVPAATRWLSCWPTGWPAHWPTAGAAWTSPSRRGWTNSTSSA